MQRVSRISCLTLGPSHSSLLAPACKRATPSGPVPPWLQHRGAIPTSFPRRNHPCSFLHATPCLYFISSKVPFYTPFLSFCPRHTFSQKTGTQEVTNMISSSTQVPRDHLLFEHHVKEKKKQTDTYQSPRGRERCVYCIVCVCLCCVCVCFVCLCFKGDDVLKCPWQSS